MRAFYFVFLAKVAAKHFISNCPPIFSRFKSPLYAVISKFNEKNTENLSFSQIKCKKKINLKKGAASKKDEGGDEQLVFFCLA